MHSGFLGSFLLVCCIVEEPIRLFIHQSELSAKHLLFTFENTRVATLRGMCFMDTIQRSQKFKKAQRLVGIEPTNHYFEARASLLCSQFWLCRNRTQFLNNTFAPCCALLKKQHKLFGSVEIQTRGNWFRSTNATSVLFRPPT